MSERSIFLNALDCEDPATRAATSNLTLHNQVA
jgi:hypothetical protein